MVFRTPEDVSRYVFAKYSPIFCLRIQYLYVRVRREMADHPYWDAFYRAAHPEIGGPTTFAMWCLPLFPQQARLVEFGCGNGRDAVFFAQSGFDVIACDQSAVAIETLAQEHSHESIKKSLTFFRGDFTRLDQEQFGPVDVVYSRFTLHAITQAEATSALAWAAANLRPQGLLALEVRSVKGDLYGRGEPRERDAFVYNGHYRRFVRLDELVAELTRLGFTLQHTIESAGLAVHQNDDPVVIRVIAQRP